MGLAHFPERDGRQVRELSHHWGKSFGGGCIKRTAKQTQCVWGATMPAHPRFGNFGYPARRMGSSQNLEGSGPCPEDLTMNSRVGLGQDAGPVEGRSARDR